MINGLSNWFARWKGLFLRLSIEHKILIASSFLIVFWALEGHYVNFLPWGIPTILLLGLSILVNLILIRLALTPIHELCQFMDLIARKNINVRARYHPLGGKLANQCVDSLNKMLDSLEETHNTLEAERERSRRQAKLVIKAQEEERKRIAKELHDGTSQTLAALLLGFEKLYQEIPNSVGRSLDCKQHIAKMKELTDRMIVELHRLAFNLRPSLLDDMGLKQALSWLLREQVEKKGIKVNFTSDDIHEPLPDDMEIALFRVVQEALTNIMKYAKATHVSVQLRCTTTTIHLEVSDNGIGFEISEINVNKDNQLGIFGMEERMVLLLGTFRLESAPGKGTQIYATAPIVSR